MEDVNYLMGHGTEDAYLFTVHSSRRNLDLYPDPNEYVVEFDNPFRNVVGLEVVQALLPRSQYMVDTHNQRLVIYVAETRFFIDIPIGEYTHDSLRDVLNQKLNPIGVTASFQDRGRNVFELHSDRVLKLDVLGSTLTRLLGFNTDAEYPDLDLDGSKGGVNVERNLVDHAWTLHPGTPPWFDQVTGLPNKALTLEHSGDFASISGPFTLTTQEKAVAFSYRYSHNMYTPASFRLPKWSTLCQTPNGYDIDIGLGDIRVRRYSTFHPEKAQKPILIPLEPDQTSSPLMEDSETLFFSFGRNTLMDATHAYHIVPQENASIGDEMLIRNIKTTWEGGLAIAHYDQEGYLDIRAINSEDVPFSVSHINPSTNLVDRQMYLVSTIHYQPTQGKVPIFRYGAHPTDDKHTGHIEIQLDDENLVCERFVEETADQIVTIPLVSSIHDTAEPTGFTEPQIEEGSRYASTVSNEYTFSVYISKTEWENASVEIGSFHRIIFMGSIWNTRVHSMHPTNERQDLVRLDVSIYDPGRSLIDAVFQFTRALQDPGLGMGWARRIDDFSSHVDNGVFAWMVECWILILRVKNGSPLDAELEASIRDLVLQGVVGLIQREKNQESITMEDWDDFRRDLNKVQEATSYLSGIPIWDNEIIAWDTIAEQRNQGTANIHLLESSLKKLVEMVGLYGSFDPSTWVPLIQRWVAIFESIQGNSLDEETIILMQQVILHGVAVFIQELIAHRPILSTQWISWGEQVQALLDTSLGPNEVWQTELETWRNIGIQGGVTDYQVLLTSLFRLRDEADVSNPGQEGRGVPGGAVLVMLNSTEESITHIIPFQTPSVVSVVSLPEANIEFPRVIDTMSIDEIPCFGLTLTRSIDLRLQRSWFLRSDSLSHSLPEFLSNTQVQPDPVWGDENAWIVDASSFIEPPYKAFNTTNLSPGDGWRSESRTSPARFPNPDVGNPHSPLLYWRTPSEALVGEIHEMIRQIADLGESDLRFALGVEKQPHESYAPYSSMGNQWNVGLGGQNGVVVRGDSRAPALFACHIRIPDTVDLLYNTVVCAIGGQSNAMAVGFDQDGNLFARCGNGRSLDPMETSMVRLDPHLIPSFLGYKGWLSWFLLPSTFGVQISLYWNGVSIGRAPRTSSQITRWSDSESGGYLSLSTRETILPWSEQTPHWIRLHYANRPLTIQRYTIETINDVRDSEYTYPMEFSLQVSNDNVRWKTLDTRSFEEWTSRTARSFDVSDDGVYWYIRLWITRAKRLYVSIGQWSLDVLAATEQTADHYEVAMMLFGTSSLRRVGILDAGKHPQIPRVNLSWEGKSHIGFLEQFQPVSETGVSIESKVYVNQSQNPLAYVQSGDDIRIRSSMFQPTSNPDIDISGTVRHITRGQGTHPKSGIVTDAIEWFLRQDEITPMFQNYIENRLVEHGEIQMTRMVSAQRIQRRILYPRLKGGHIYTLTIRLLPDGTLRYVVLDHEDSSEFQSRYYTIDPVPVMGLLDAQNTGRMTGFEQACLILPQRGYGINKSETYSLLQDVRWSYQTSITEKSDSMFMPFEEYTIEQPTTDGIIQSLIVRVPNVPVRWESAFPERSYHNFGSGTSQFWSFDIESEDATRYWLIGFLLEGYNLTSLDNSLHDMLHVETHTGFPLMLGEAIVQSRRAFVPILHNTYEPLSESRVNVSLSEQTNPDNRIWNVSVIAYDTFDETACYYEYEHVSLPQQVQNAVLCSDGGEVQLLNGEENQTQILISPVQPYLYRNLLRIPIPRSNSNEMLRLSRLEIGDVSYMKSVFQDTFRYVEDTIYAYSKPMRQGGVFVRDLIPSVTEKMETVEAFRWIQYFTIDDTNVDEMSLHTMTIFFPDDTIFDRSLPLTFTLRDENSQVLDEFSTFWDRGTDSKGRIVEKTYGNDRIGPFTQLSSIVVAYDKFRTSTDIHLKRGVRYSLLVSTLDVLVFGENENVTDLDRMFPLRIAYVPSQGSMKGFVATYKPDTREPEWIDGFAPLRVQMANVEHQIVSPGITTLSPDSFLKLSIPEIEQHVFVHRNYDQWTGGMATFFLSPGLEHREFNEHMHVGLIKRFFPIGRLDQMTIRFLSEDNRPYNFRGVNHVLRLVLRFLVPKWDPFAESLLAPHYDPSRYGSYQKSNEGETTLDESEPSTSLTNIRDSLSTGSMIGTPLEESNGLTQNSEEFIRTMKAYAKVVREAGTVLESLSTK